MVNHLGYDKSHEIIQSLIFFSLTALIQMIIDLPGKLYSTFVVEERHGFNKQTLGLFCVDFAKGLMLGGKYFISCV